MATYVQLGDVKTWYDEQRLHVKIPWGVRMPVRQLVLWPFDLVTEESVEGDPYQAIAR